MGQRRFSGESLDPKEYRRWRLWALAKMASTKDMTPTHRGPYVFCLLDGLALEHLTLDLLREENGDKHIWKCQKVQTGPHREEAIHTGADRHSEEVTL